MTRTLMIGGPADGTRVLGVVNPHRVVQERRPGELWTRVPIDTDAVSNSARHVYVADVLRVGDETFHFYRHERLSTSMALQMLLQGYKP